MSVSIFGTNTVTATVWNWNSFLGLCSLYSAQVELHLGHAAGDDATAARALTTSLATGTTTNNVSVTVAIITFQAAQ